MEKNAVKQKRRFHLGLLIFALLSLNPAFAKKLTVKEIRAQKIIPDKTIFFTGQENGYTLTLPGISPSTVQTDLPTLPSGVNFLSSKREEFIDEDGDRGTLVQLWFSFTDTGTVKLPSLSVQVGVRTFRLPFESVTVYENPATIMPAISVDFGDTKVSSENGLSVIRTEAGKPLKFTVSIYFCSQIVDFKWSLPQKSIFTETMRYGIAQGQNYGKVFSTDPLPVATFQWTPLSAGVYRLPDMYLMAIAYNGSRRQVEMPLYKIEVLPPTGAAGDSSSISDDSASSLFTSSFETPIEESVVAPAKVVDCRRIAELRSMERHSFPWSGAREIRRQFEAENDISNGKDEPSEDLSSVLWGMFLVSSMAWIFFLVIKKIRIALVLMLPSAVFLFASLALLVALSPQYGIFAGGEVSPVPEEKVTTTHTEVPGIRVEIDQRAGDWVYITAGENAGWVKENSVYEID